MAKSTDVNEKFIKYLKTIIRKNKIISQRELAARIGYTEVSISRYLNNERTMSMDAVIKICNALNIDVIEFISFYGSYFSNDEFISRFNVLSDENKLKTIEYMEYLQYKDINAKKIELKSNETSNN